MKYIEMGKNQDGIMIYGRQDDDGLVRFTCTSENPDYQAHLAANSTPSVSNDSTSNL